ncbi:MAG: PAS domain-containing protein [Gammaproteobacteria bacterium]
MHTRQLVDEVEAAGMAVRVLRTVEEASALFDKSQVRERPTVFIFGPAVENPITLARRLHYQVPRLHVIFTVIGAEREQKLRRDLTYAAPLGSRWTVEPADSKTLSSVIPKAFKTLSQQQRLRTTLDRINVTLAAPVPPDVRDYRRLVVSDRYLASILTHAQDAIVSLDTRGIVVSWNAGAERLFDVSERQAIGQAIVALVGDSASLREALQQALGGSSVRLDLQLPASGKFLDATFTAIGSEAEHPLGIAVIIRDVTARVSAEAALRESEARLRDILDRAPAVVFLKDRAGRRLFVNAEYLRIFARQPQEVLGKTDSDLFPAEIARALNANDEQVWRTGMPRAVEETVPQTDGLHTYITQKFLLRDSTGTPYALCGIATDISERLRIEQALRESDRRKDEFLATLAHELRNPLAPIRHAVTIAGMQGVSPDKLKWSREVIDRQVRHMARLLDDLLDVSRITRGKLELRKERVYLASVVGTAIETVRPLIETKKHELTVDLPIESIRLEADPIRLAQVFSNLLTNAAKYTDAGGRIAVQGRLMGSHVQVRITDNGIGFGPEAQAQLFQMFSQVTPALERSDGGLGIGLALVRGLIELHEGTVEARSDGPGRGSEFVVRLPVSLTEAYSPADSSDGENEARSSTATGVRVVVADDNRDSLESLAILLRLQGYDVHTACNGREALSLVTRVRPAIAILDIGMPELNGYEVAENIRAQPSGGELILIAFSGWGQEQDKQRARNAGFDYHFTKPLNIERLQEVLLRVSSVT